MASSPIAAGHAQARIWSVTVAGPQITILDEDGGMLIVARWVRSLSGERFRCMPAIPLRAPQPSPTAGSGLGDLGFLDETPDLHLHGRLKEIINRGGEKIAPREVDEALLDHPAVAQAVTFALPHDKLGEDVAAAVVLREGQTASEREFRISSPRHRRFKVPRRIVFLEEIPKGPTGKVQRIGLGERLGLGVGALDGGRPVPATSRRGRIESTQ